MAGMVDDTAVKTCFGDLPVDVIHSIMLKTNFRTAARLSATCKSAHVASESNELWRNMYQQRWRNRGDWPKEHLYGESHWKEAFRARHYESCDACDRVVYNKASYLGLCDSCEEHESRHNLMYD